MHENINISDIVTTAVLRSTSSSEHEITTEVENLIADLVSTMDDDSDSVP